MVSAELAEIFGIHAGDGYLRNDGKKRELDISCHVEDKDYYDKHIAKLFLKEFGIEPICRYFPARNTYGFVVRQKEIIELFHEFGFPYGRKGDIVKVPDSVLFSHNLDVKAKFLRGLADTDGCLTFDRKFNGKYSKFKREKNYYPRIILTTISEELCKDVSGLLRNLNFRYRIQKYKSKHIEEHMRYIIWITGAEQLEKWITQVGFANYGKYSRYLVWKKLGYCPPKTTLEQRTNILKGKPDTLHTGA